jgi:hypothetical protein
MKRYLPLLLCIAIAACIRSLSPQLEDVENDRSILFPQFFERTPVGIAEPGQTYEFDGVTLRALAIAANDFLPPDGANVPCVERREAHVYRIIRQGDILFIRIDENPGYCGRKYGRLDSGAEYAISTGGRILRRVLDGWDEYVAPADGGTPIPGEPGVSPSFDPAHLQPLPFMNQSQQDAGVDGGAPPSP